MDFLMSKRAAQFPDAGGTGKPALLGENIRQYNLAEAAGSALSSSKPT